MKKRKLIACLTNAPDNIYQQRVLEGLIARCNEHGYDLAVFSSLVNCMHFYKDYLYAENNIFELVNFDMVDAVVVVSLPFTGMGDYSLLNSIEKILKQRCKKPVVCLDMAMGGYHTVWTNDCVAFERITHHIVDVHKCEKIYFLAGAKQKDVEDQRLAGFLSGMKQCGREIREDRIFFGDFWYSSGQQLAKRIVSGELEMPEAVICASDHMAIGLVNELLQGGVKVPEDVIVTGFDATQEALVNDCSITTFAPDNHSMTAKAIDYLRSKIDPFEPITPYNSDNLDDNLFIGLSCGCHVNYKHVMRRLSSTIYKLNRNHDDKKLNNNEDISHLVESYMLEALTESQSPEECLSNIDRQTYLLQPLDHFYLCLRPDWLDTDSFLKDGYPRKMRCTIHSVSVELQESGTVEFFHTDDDRMLFDTSLMLPVLYEEREKPNIFYFAPVHFQQNTLGYAVLQNEMDTDFKVTCVLRNWLRNVNNAIEMARVNHRLVDDSEIDKMTGLKNRRGMENSLRELMYNVGGNHFCYAIVFDMDGLKHINDNYGHNEGDFAIISIAHAIDKLRSSNEIAVRAGGDEFYLIGVSNHITEKTLIDKVSRYRVAMEEINRLSGKPYDIGASVGFCMKKMVVPDILSEVIREADKHMYVCKAENKRHRR